jgi:hypothetical protein
VSADSCVSCIGLRYDIETFEVEALEARADPRQIAARNAGLRSDWANFGGADECYVLYVGTEVAVFGPEGKSSVCLAPQEIAEMISETRKELDRTGLSGEVALHIEFLEGASHYFLFSLRNLA